MKTIGYILAFILLIFFLYGMVRLLGYAWWKSKFEAWFTVTGKIHKRKESKNDECK